VSAGASARTGLIQEGLEASKRGDERTATTLLGTRSVRTVRVVWTLGRHPGPFEMTEFDLRPGGRTCMRTGCDGMVNLL
jgi:hypothetical protein